MLLVFDMEETIPLMPMELFPKANTNFRREIFFRIAEDERLKFPLHIYSVPINYQYGVICIFRNLDISCKDAFNDVLNLTCSLALRFSICCSFLDIAITVMMTK